MSSPYVKFVYNPGSGQVTFQPTYAPRNLPALSPVATRHDNIASSGLKESILERIDQFLELDFKHVPSSDVTAWKNFLNYALAGGAFQFYLDASSANYINYTLDSTDGALAYVSLGLYSLKLKLRQVVS